MKVLCKEVNDEGLLSLLGKQITVFTPNYIYVGELIGVNETCIKLEKPSIAYETGDWSTQSFKDIQQISREPHYIQLSAIISFGVTK